MSFTRQFRYRIFRPESDVLDGILRQFQQASETLDINYSKYDFELYSDFYITIEGEPSQVMQTQFDLTTEIIRLQLQIYELMYPTSTTPDSINPASSGIIPPIC